MAAIDSRQFTFPSAGGDLFCGHCLRNSAELRRDRKGRPYLWCVSCRSRSFIGSDAGLTAVRTMSADVLASLARRLREVGSEDRDDESLGGMLDEVAEAAQ